MSGRERETAPLSSLGRGRSFVMEHDRSSSRPAEIIAEGLKRRGGGGGGGGFFSSDENALTKQILGTHAPGIDDLNVKPLLAVIEDILRLGSPTLSTHDNDNNNNALTAGARSDANLDHQPGGKKKVVSFHDDISYTTPDHDLNIVAVLALPINRISSEMICKCNEGGGEAHSATMNLLRSLSNYSWDVKVGITFAAFAINYGEFCLVDHLRMENPLAKNIATLKDLPHTMDNAAAELKHKLEAVVILLNTALNVTRFIVKFKELPSAYITHDSPEITAATAHIPTAVYWIIRSLMASFSLLLNLVGSSGHEYMSATAESWEILSLTHKLEVISAHLKKQLAICLGLVDKKKSEDAYIAFKRLIETSHIDNMKVLRAMIRTTEDQMPLYDGSKRTNERLEALRSKYILLLITDLDVPHEEINVLHMIYNQHAMRHEYEVLWLPVVDPTTAPLQDNVFYDLRNNNMPWYSVTRPSLVEPVAIRYFKEVWNFTHMPMLVVLDPQGKPSNLNALPMMWIWGGHAFPFTKARERALWDDHTWNIDLLADAIDPRIPEWTRGNRVICLYGGEDIDWIRKFTLSARAAASALHVPLEMLYVGKRNPRDKVRRCHEVINREKLSHIFPLAEYYDYVWYFWVRLWSMWNSKKHIGMSVDDDRIMREIMDMLTFDSSKEGWAVFSRGNYEMAKGKGDVVLPVLDNYTAWGYNVDHPDKFVAVVEEEIRRAHPEHHCNHLILPGQTGYIPERVACSQCGKIMEHYVMYSCCND
ncbi:protein SIEVE ELEMENT OCCLUSION B-like [Andrographis paniculata]|uniref:protein SIEVE ELEMENT OCCLUSION B-like n=1 Tax=Andrographis paniculata TaxID=175694 RepID=UPI0021E78D87|nr:protein SIEVE ELEMENT OCCLUSION B-like [Andrographis paniculata]